MLTVEDRPRGCGGPQLLTKGHGAVEALPSHETQRLAPGKAESQVPRDARYWWTYQRHRGNVGTMLLTHKRAPPAKGDQPQNWRATDPSTSGHQPHNWAGRRLLVNLVGVLESCEFLRRQRVGGHYTLLNGKASELSGLPSTMSWPRSVCEARFHCVRGRNEFFLLFAFRSASLGIG